MRGGNLENEGLKCTNVSVPVVILCDRGHLKNRRAYRYKKVAQERVCVVGSMSIAETFGH